MLYSKDLIKFARKRGYFSGKDEDFSFADAFEHHSPATRRGCDARVWSFFRRYSPEMEKYYAWCSGTSEEPMPLYIVPDKKVSLKDMQERVRDHFEDTPFNMTSDPGAGPYHVPYRWRPMTYEVDGKEYVMERAIATQQTGWSFVSEPCRPPRCGGRRVLVRHGRHQHVGLYAFLLQHDRSACAARPRRHQHF